MRVDSTASVPHLPTVAKDRLQVRTVIISDVHLGTPNCKAEEVIHFLRHVRCDKLILNGDIIDGWQLRRGGAWSKRHTRFVRIVLKMLEKRGAEVVYLRGNHDDILERLLPINFGRLSIAEDHVHNGVRGPYLVLHGDVFDTVTKNFVFLAHAGDWGYRALLRLNRFYNAWRSWRGKEYWSLSRAIKARVKKAVNHVSRFEQHISRLALERGCIGVMCGHVHTAADKMIGSVHYLNSGDWVESLTAIVEYPDGRYELIDFATFCLRFPMMRPTDDLATGDNADEEAELRESWQGQASTP